MDWVIYIFLCVVCALLAHFKFVTMGGGLLLTIVMTIGWVLLKPQKEEKTQDES